MSKALTVTKGVTLVKEGNKIVTYLRQNMKGEQLARQQAKNRQSFDIARQVLTTVTP